MKRCQELPGSSLARRSMVRRLYIDLFRSLVTARLPHRNSLLRFADLPIRCQISRFDYHKVHSTAVRGKSPSSPFEPNLRSQKLVILTTRRHALDYQSRSSVVLRVEVSYRVIPLSSSAANYAYSCSFIRGERGYHFRWRS